MNSSTLAEVGITRFSDIEFSFFEPEQFQLTGDMAKVYHPKCFSFKKEREERNWFEEGKGYYIEIHKADFPV